MQSIDADDIHNSYNKTSQYPAIILQQARKVSTSLSEVENNK